jgi:NAD(P)H-hydrate epimerase
MGPGLGVDFAVKAVNKALPKLSCPIILDADMLTALAQMPEMVKLHENTIITPHVGEAARMLNKSNEYVKNNTVECAKELVYKTGAITVIKCHNTVVVNPKGQVFINTTGNAGMATGGSGDVLAGLMGALIKRMDIYDAAKYAVYLHGLAGDIAKLKYGENSMTAKNIVECIPDAFATLEKYKYK